MYINIRVQYVTSIVTTQNGLYNLKQYDNYTIKYLMMVHITLLYTINICAE